MCGETGINNTQTPLNIYNYSFGFHSKLLTAHSSYFYRYVRSLGIKHHRDASCAEVLHECPYEQPVTTVTFIGGYRWYGAEPVASSMAVIPKLQMSALKS